MTYCLAIALDSGLVFAADSRTNAGVDYVTTYGKMHVFEPSPDRIFVLLAAGSLATTQEVVHRLRSDLASGAPCTLATVPHLFEAAAYVGRLNRETQEKHLPALARAGFNGEASFILGGQIRGQPPAVLLVYPQGNCIAASAQTPYLQIGETKYGKPMLDRVSGQPMTLADAARVALVSLDATMRSNITVGPPFELAVMENDSLRIGHHLSLKPTDPLFRRMQKRWQDGLRRTLATLPRFEWETD